MPWDGIRRVAAAIQADYAVVHRYVYGEKYRLKKEKHAQESAAKRLKKVDFPISPRGLYGYLRVSQSVQARPNANGLPRQREVVTEYCEENGFSVPDVVFIEEIASAFNGEHLKKKLGRFLELARQGALGTASHLFMEEFDRFSRLGLDRTLHLIRELKDGGVTMHFIWNKRVL
jgi:hypothetical protein